MHKKKKKKKKGKVQKKKKDRTYETCDYSASSEPDTGSARSCAQSRPGSPRQGGTRLCCRSGTGRSCWRAAGGRSFVACPGWRTVPVWSIALRLGLTGGERGRRARWLCARGVASSWVGRWVHLLTRRSSFKT